MNHIIINNDAFKPTDGVSQNFPALNETLFTSMEDFLDKFDDKECRLVSLELEKQLSSYNHKLSSIIVAA